jgi:tryptophan synthase alpha chain
MALEPYIREGLVEKDILFMTHMVLGYPSFEDCYRMISEMVKAGVDIMELQIPFSEPIADGPVILGASHKALKNGVTVQDCLDFIAEITHAFKIPFLVMSYYNILFRYGIEAFIKAMADRGLMGAIVPDLPHEEGEEYLDAMRAYHLDPILIFSPTTSRERMRAISSHGEGFIYCVARKGVTGLNTDFSDGLTSYLARCREATHRPLAVGFGVKERADIDYLKGKAEIAVMGTQVMKIMEKDGIGAVGGFLRDLR